MLLTNFNVPIVDCPELNIPGEEIEVLTKAWFTVRIFTYLLFMIPKTVS